MTLIDEVRCTRSMPPPALARAVRQAAGISQARLARELGVTRVTVARWELGSRRPRGDLLVAYAAVLRQLQGLESA